MPAHRQPAGSQVTYVSRRVLFLGPQGSGKGTQAARLSTLLGVPHISSGDMLRRAVVEGTDLGRRAAGIMAAGDLVPDDLVVAMVAERLGQGDAACGFLLDGFPRTLPQAQALDEALHGDAVDTVVLLWAPEHELLERLMKRALEQGRTDDTAEAITRRLALYREETAPLVDYYPAQGVAVAEVDGLGTIDAVFVRIVNALAGAW